MERGKRRGGGGGRDGRSRRVGKGEAKGWRGGEGMRERGREGAAWAAANGRLGGRWVWPGRVSPMARNARGTPVDAFCGGSSGAWVGFGGPRVQRSGLSNHGRRLHFKTHVMKM